MAVRVPFKVLQSIEHRPIDLYANHLKLLHFFTFGCINCMHTFLKLKRVETKYAQLKIVSINTPKFTQEACIKSLKKSMYHLGVTHDVVMDEKQLLWDAFAVKAWPTLVLVDESGRIVFQEQGELCFDALESELSNRLEDAFQSIEENQSLTAVAIDGSYLAVSRQKRLQIYKNREFYASFEGFEFIVSLYINEEKLYVCDRGRGEVVYIDLALKERRVLLDNVRSPWGVAQKDHTLFIALAGSHKIVTFDLKSHELAELVGNGFEGLRDGCGSQALLAQPSALVRVNEALYFIDAESSSLRVIDHACVQTLMGFDLFSFGDDDTKQLLQHPQAMVGNEKGLFIADSYNKKIRFYDLETKSVHTLFILDEMPISLGLYEQKLIIITLNSDTISVFDTVTKEEESIDVL